MQAYGERAAAFWFRLGIASVEMLSIACCHRRRPPERGSRPEHGGQSSDDAAGEKSTEARVENVENDAGKSGRSCQYLWLNRAEFDVDFEADGSASGCVYFTLIELFATHVRRIEGELVLGREDIFPLPTQLHNRTTILALHSVESTRVYHRPPL